MNYVCVYVCVFVYVHVFAAVVNTQRLWLDAFHSDGEALQTLSRNMQNKQNF